MLEYLDVWWDGVYNSDHRVLCPLQREQDAGVGDSRVNHQVIYIHICIVYTKNISDMDSGYIQQIYWFQLFYKDSINCVHKKCCINVNIGHCISVVLMLPTKDKAKKDPKLFNLMTIWMLDLIFCLLHRLLIVSYEMLLWKSSLFLRMQKCKEKYSITWVQSSLKSHPLWVTLYKYVILGTYLCLPL